MTWSKWVVYVDDTRFEKVELYKDVAFMFAGLGLRIQEWKDWIRSKPMNAANMPACNGMAVCMVDTTSNRVLFSERQDIVKDGAYFAGTGSRYAYLCWDKNRNAQKSVATAKEVDIFTGGEVKYFNGASGDHNLHHVTVDVTIDMVVKAIQTRGMVMEIANGTTAVRPPFKLSDIAAKDVELQELQSKVANGSLSVEAPCDGMYSEWSSDEKTRFTEVLSKVFSWK